MDLIHHDQSVAYAVRALPAFDVAKRAFDILVGLLLLVLFAPLLVLIAWLVRRQSPGPALFQQERAGLNGRTFRIYKFRTMYRDADRSGPLITGSDDPRITPIGRVLRGCKLDELPQLINVVRGDMSLVGPRPQVPQFANAFPPDLRAIILSVRPGITGPTQLRYRNEEMLLEGRADRERYYIEHIMPAKCRLDAAYVRDRCAATDALALAETAWLAVRGVGLRLRRQHSQAVVCAAIVEERTGSR